MKVALFSLFFLSLMVIFSTGTAHAADDGSMIYVNGSSGNDSNNGYSWLTAKQTIGNATGTVATNGTVTIANGTYSGTGNVGISITNNMTITGLDQNGTIIDGEGTSQIFTISAGVTVTIENLTLTNGYATTGGAVYDEGDLTIQNCNIINNTADYGGGIYTSTNSACTIIDSTISSNTATNYGGGIAINGTCTITNSTITSNTTKYGGGISNDGSCTVTDSNINSNTASQHGGGIYNVGTCTVNGSAINSNTASQYGGGIYNYNTGTCTVTDSNIKNNTSSIGGGITNDGTCTVTDSNINSNTANYGGGIYNYINSICKVIDSNINNNTAPIGGGICNNSSTCAITGSTISSNTATNGGGICNNYGTLTVSGCDFESNQASYGNAIYNYGGDTSNRVVQFCRFYDHAAGYEIYSDSGSMDAQYNWWGSNKNAISKVYGNVDVSPWLVLDIDVTPVFIGKNGSSTVTANLWFDSDGNYHNPASEHIKDGISVDFYTTIGILNSPVLTSDGSAVSTLIPNMVSGVADVFAILNDQFVQTQVIIDTTSPTVTNIDPVDGAVINDTSKVVTVTFNEAVQQGSAYNDISITCNGTPVSVITSLNSNILTITNTGTYTDGTYTINIPADAVKDSVGNGIDTYTSQFTVDTIPPAVTGVDPADGAVINDTTKVVTVTFSEDILEGTTFDDISVSCNGTPLTTITKAITGNLLTLTNTASYADGTYTVNIPVGAVVDEVGNSLDTAFSSLFTMDTVAPVITSTDPVNGATNLTGDQIITVTFSEDIMMGTGWIELIDRNTGAAVDLTTSINGNILTITPTSDLAEAWYKVMIHTGCVTDLAGNMVAGKSFTFSVGTSPTITATSPVDGATNVNVAKTITVTFSEAIRKSSHFWVELVDSTGTAVAYTSYITGGNMLVIDPTSYLAAGTTYTVKLHTGCVTDLAANPVAPYVFSFTTRST